MERILIVDDEAAALKILREFFEGEDYLVSTAGNGEEALEIMAEERPDILLLDLRMPRMGGREVIKKARDFNRDLFILVLTAIQDEKAIDEAKALGADGVVSKPINLVEVLDRIRLRQSR